MSTTIALTPLHPGVGKPVRVDFTVTGGGNYLRGYFTDAPEGSEQKTLLSQAGSTRVPAFLSDSNKSWMFLPETGGVYTLLIEQYQKGASSFGGGYEGAPEGFQTETLIASGTVTLAVGQKVTQRIGFGGDTATLTLFVWNDLICASTYDLHGFISPSLAEPKTDRARTAALSPGVLAATAALVGVTATTALGVLKDVFDNLILAFRQHLTQSGIHLNNDVENTPFDSDLTPDSPGGLKQAMARLLKLLDQHMRNDNNNAGPVGIPGWADSGTGSKSYHNNNRVDWKNALLGLTAGDTLDTFIALADAHRAYNAHRLDGGATVPPVYPLHANPDVTNAPASLPPLLNLHALFLSEIQKQSPTAPPSVNAGVTALVHGAGFEEA